MDQSNENDSLQQDLARWCEQGLLEHLRIIEGNAGIKYRLTEKGKDALRHAVRHPEEFPGESGKSLIEKLKILLHEEQQ